MAGRRQEGACSVGCGGSAKEKNYPISRLGQMLIFAGLALAFLSFVFGFWLALFGAMLIAIGFLVITSC